MDAGLNLPEARPANSKTRRPVNGGGPVIVVVQEGVYRLIGRKYGSKYHGLAEEVPSCS